MGNHNREVQAAAPAKNHRSCGSLVVLFFGYFTFSGYEKAANTAGKAMTVSYVYAAAIDCRPKQRAERHQASRSVC